MNTIGRYVILGWGIAMELWGFDPILKPPETRQKAPMDYAFGSGRVKPMVGAALYDFDDANQTRTGMNLHMRSGIRIEIIPHVDLELWYQHELGDVELKRGRMSVGENSFPVDNYILKLIYAY